LTLIKKKTFNVVFKRI